MNSGGNLFEVIDLNNPVAGAIANLAVLIGETGAEIVVGSLPAIRGDETQMTQLFQDLVTNGIRFRSSQTPRIQIFAHREDGKPVVTVSDNGIGIDPAHYRRIFQIFQRQQDREGRPESGIGLAGCERIMERHGGHIELESAFGQGTVFKLKFANC